MKSPDGPVATPAHMARLRRYRRRARRVRQLAGVPAQGVVVHGPPPSVPYEAIVAVCEKLLGSPPHWIGHQHKSGWKSSGAYRVQMRASNGRQCEVFCKVNDHSAGSIPALSGLPARVGPPEKVVLDAAGRIHGRPRVPRLHAVVGDVVAREILFMESLARRWYPCTSFGPDLALAARAAAGLQGHLAHMFEQAMPEELIDYDERFSVELNEYALGHLQRYSASSGDAIATNVLSQWESLTSLYLPSMGRHVPTIVHGDLNPANVLIHVTRRHARVIDWEWAGRGDGYRDLVSLLKRAPRAVERRALNAYHDGVGGNPDWHRYEQCQLERGLLDASFFCAQFRGHGGPKRKDMTGFVQSSLRRALAAANALEG